jgi:hypothetical protein
MLTKAESSKGPEGVHALKVYDNIYEYRQYIAYKALNYELNDGYRKPNRHVNQPAQFESVKNTR